MTNVRISKKGKALLRNKQLSQLILRAIGADSDGLYTARGITVPVGDKSLTVRSVSAVNRQHTDR